MASEREVDELATQVTRGLKLDPGGQLLDMEELVYKASPAELETLRQQVLMKQDLSGFDDEGLIERFVQATKPRGVDNGAGDNSQSYFNCFQNQIMMAMVVERSEQLPPDLMQQWMCVVCPQGSRVLVIASHKSTRVYDLEGTWICEHDTHLPGGSPSDISKLDVFTDDRGCTILDCLFNNEQEIYYVVDLLCWKGQSYYKYDTSVRMKTVAEKMEEVPSLMVVSQTNPVRNRYHQQFHNFSLNPFYPAYQGAYGYGNYGDYGGYDNYRGYGGYNSGGYNQGSYNQMNYNQMGYNPGNFNHGNYGQGNYNRTSTGQQRMFPQQFNYSHQGYRDNQRGHQKNKADGPIKRIQLSIPVPDDRPNWPDYERHDVMMSVSMEYVPENFETEYMAVICPVAKRRIVVSYFGWTCSYNKLLNMDRKFQSALPGGNVHSVQVIKSNDMCILDCLHLKAERTFYILDLMHWKQLPYYQSEAEFRFHWINQVENEMDLTTIHPENEYKFKSMPRLRCTRDVLYNALANSTFKVDGLLFFHINGLYTPGTSPNVLWLPPEEIESVLGWKPPDHILPKKAKAAGAASKPAAAESAAGESSAADEATSAAAAATS